MANIIYTVSINGGKQSKSMYDKTLAESAYNKLKNKLSEDIYEVSLSEYDFDTDCENEIEKILYQPDDYADNVIATEEVCDDICKESVLVNLVYVACAVLNDMKHIHLNCCGKSFDRIHEISNNYYEKLSEDFDTLAEIALEDCGIQLANPSNMVGKIEWTPITDNIIDYDKAICLFDEIINKFICEINCAYECVSHDIQSELDNIIRYWTKEIKFKNVRRKG